MSNSCDPLSHPGRRRLSDRQQKPLKLVLLFLFMSALCSAIPISSVYAQATMTSCSSTDTNFCWHGGPVQHDPKVYLVFWGSTWNSDATSIYVKDQLVSFFQHLAGGNYNNILTQYGDGNGQINNDTVMESAQVDTVHSIPVTPLSTSSILQEAEQANMLFNWPEWDNDTQIMVFPQEGTAYSGELNTIDDACGKHAYLDTLSFSFVRFESTEDSNDLRGCGSGATEQSIAEDMTMTASHEYAETVTNPNGSNGWWAYQACTESCNWQQEIGDKCNQEPSPYSPASDPSLSFNVQLLWSNSNNGSGNGCVSYMGSQFASPVSPGQHTVQGSILSEYENVGQATSVIGPPISEEMPIGSGRVSYFTGGCGTNYPKGNCAAIYWSPGSGAYYVRNAEYQEYVAVGQAASVIGFPVSKDTAIGNGGAVTYFNGTCGGTNKCAAIYWSGGSGAHYVRNAEFQEYQKVGEAASVIGFPVTDDTAIGNGGAVTYFNGTCGGTNKCAAIYWSGGSGAHYVRNAEYQEYVAVGQAASVVGFPVTDDTAIGNGGAVTYFNGTCGGTNKCAAIYWSGNTGAQLVRGGDYQLYVTLGEANGILGFPTTREISTNGGSVQYFSKNDACNAAGPNNSDSAIYWSPSTGSHEVHGCIYNFYQQFGGLNSALGFPVSDEEGITDYWGDPGRVSYFKGAYCGNGGPDGSGSAIYWWGGAHEVQGCIYAKYQQIGGSNSKLGFPISNEYTNSLGYRESDFSNGEIIWENGTAVVIYQTGCVTTGKCN